MSCCEVCSLFTCSSDYARRADQQTYLDAFCSRAIVWRTLVLMVTCLVGVQSYANGADAVPAMVGVHDIELAENVVPQSLKSSSKRSLRQLGRNLVRECD